MPSRLMIIKFQTDEQCSSLRFELYVKCVRRGDLWSPENTDVICFGASSRRSLRNDANPNRIVGDGIPDVPQ